MFNDHNIDCIFNIGFSKYLLTSDADIEVRLLEARNAFWYRDSHSLEVLKVGSGSPVSLSKFTV